jgi:hypothetical protein
MARLHFIGKTPLQHTVGARSIHLFPGHAAEVSATEEAELRAAFPDFFAPSTSTARPRYGASNKVVVAPPKKADEPKKELKVKKG